MKIEILGNSGSACKSHYTSCVLIDDSIALDAGTGMHSLSIRQMRSVQDILITHSHMDHIAMLCFLADYHAIHGSSLAIHCLPQTADDLQRFLFNNKVWPAMHNIYNKHNNPIISFNILTPYKKIKINNCEITPLPVNHGIPTLGYCLHGDKENFVFCFDMIDAPDKFWRYLKRLKNFKRIAMELSFPGGMEELARASHHLTPPMMKELMKKMPAHVNILYNHNKAPHGGLIRRQVRQLMAERVQPLQRRSVFHI